MNTQADARILAISISEKKGQKNTIYHKLNSLLTLV